MAIQIKSSEVQQNFGRVVDQALVEDDVIIERYGEPWPVLIGYQRYQQLLKAEQTLAGLHLAQPNRTQDAREKGQALEAAVRDEVASQFSGDLEETMMSLRGRSGMDSHDSD